MFEQPFVIETDLIDISRQTFPLKSVSVSLTFPTTVATLGSVESIGFPRILSKQEFTKFSFSERLDYYFIVHHS